MKLKICRYSSSFASACSGCLLLVCLLFCVQVLPLAAQQARPTYTPKRDQKKAVAKPDTIPFYNGVSVEVDLFGLGGKLLGTDYVSSEVSIVANLKNRFLPTLEVGLGAADTWSETGIHYKSKAAPFFRIGVDYNTMAKKQEKRSYLYAGVRYAATSFRYDVSSLPVSDALWGDVAANTGLTDGYWKQSVPYGYTDMKGSMQWLELVVGIRAHIYKRLYMGWSVRMKYKTSASTDEHGLPWYVPGFGKYQSNIMGMTYSLIYQLPF